MNNLTEIITELNSNYNALGEDLVLLEALIGAVQGETVFPEDSVESAVYRMGDYIEQHTEELMQMAESASRYALSRDCPAHVIGRSAQRPFGRCKHCLVESGGSNGRPAPGMERKKMNSRGTAALHLQSKP